MRSFRSKPVGWRGESHRHYLAAKGVRTKYYSDIILAKSHHFDEARDPMGVLKTRATVLPGNKIALVDMKNVSPEEAVDTIAHEELHIALRKHVGPAASKGLDRIQDSDTFEFDSELASLKHAIADTVDLHSFYVQMRNDVKFGKFEQSQGVKDLTFEEQGVLEDEIGNRLEELRDHLFNLKLKIKSLEKKRMREAALNQARGIE